MIHKHASKPTRETVTLDSATSKKWTGILGTIGLFGLIASGIGLGTDRAQFFHSYLTSYMFCLSLTLGCLFFTVLQHLVGAHWSIVVRRIAEVVMSNVGLMVILFVPVALGLHDLYHWTHHDAVAHDRLLQQKEPYLNTTFFFIRIAVYFLVWFGVSRFFFQRSVQVDETQDVGLIQSMRRFSAPSILLFALTQTFASFDLLMSLDPHWFSTIFGVYFFAGSVVSAFSLIALIALLLRSSGKLVNEITPEHYHDLGKLMFAFTVFWTYIAFSQYFLIWYGNIPEETIFYLNRWEGGWRTVSLFLAIGHFIVPFVILMSRHAKRKLALLGFMACWIVFMQYVDMYWLVLPNLHKQSVGFHWLDVATWMGVTGIWGAVIVRRLGQQALIPAQDPLLIRSLEFENV